MMKFPHYIGFTYKWLISRNILQNVVDPDKCILDNVEDNDFVPNDDSIIDAEDGGSSEDELDKEEETGK